MQLKAVIIQSPLNIPHIYHNRSLLKLVEIKLLRVILHTFIMERQIEQIVEIIHWFESLLNKKASFCHNEYQYIFSKACFEHGKLSYFYFFSHHVM